MERAGFWHRALAAGLDLLIGGVAVAVGGVAVVLAVSVAGAAAPLEDFVLAVASTALPLAYTSTEVWFAATPGKLILGLRVGTAAGEPAGKWTLALRWSSKYFGWFVGLIHAVTVDPATYFLSGWANTVVLVGCLQALDEHRRAWHDEWAGTAVLRRAAAPRWDAPATPPRLPTPAA